MNEYQLEQYDALSQLLRAMEAFSEQRKERLLDEMRPYLNFRQRVDRFTERHFSPFCTAACFQNEKSACCSKDGIITYWADLVVNAFNSKPQRLVQLQQAVSTPYYTDKCIYLNPDGCLWDVRPLVCAFFLCDQLQKDALSGKPEELEVWNDFKQTSRSFQWPDRPVLFDRLEDLFIAAGCDSTLMYLHKSPGLLAVKKKAGFRQP